MIQSETVVIKSTVLKVMSVSASDGLTRLVVSGTNTFSNSNWNGLTIFATIKCLSDVSIGDTVAFTANVAQHPAYENMLSAEALPEADIELRFKSLLESSILSIATSKNESKGSLLDVCAIGKPRVIRRPGEIRDPFIARAVRILDDEKFTSHIGDVLFVQPGSIPPDAPEHFLSGLSNSRLFQIKKTIIEKRAEQLFGSIWTERPSELGPVRNSSIATGVVEPAVYAVDKNFKSLLCIMPYDPISPSCVQWHTVTGFSGEFSPRETMSPEAECELTTRHEVAHLLQSLFISKETPTELRLMMSECFCDALAIMGYLRDGGNPEDVEKWIRMRFLGALSGNSSHSTGSACTDALEIGLTMRKSLAKGIAGATPYDMAVKALIIAESNTPYNPKMAFSSLTRINLRLLSRKKILNALRGALCALSDDNYDIMLRQISGIEAALKYVWLPYELKNRNNLPQAIKTQKESMSKHLEFLHRYGMGNLSDRSLGVFCSKRPESSSKTKPNKSKMTNRLFYSVSGFTDIRVRISDLLKKEKFSAVSISQTVVQPYVMRRSSLRNALRGAFQNIELYEKSVLQRLGYLSKSIECFKTALQDRNIPSMAYYLNDALGLCFSMCMDTESFLTVEVYLRKSLSKELVALCHALSREQCSPIMLEEHYAELKLWALGSMSDFQKSLQQVCNNDVLLMVSRHELWIDGLPEGKCLNGHNLDFKGADLSNRRLDGAILHSPDFSNAILDETSLRTAVLHQPVFSGAYLNKVDNTGTDIAMSSIMTSRGSTPLLKPAMTDERRRTYVVQPSFTGHIVSDADADVPQSRL